MKTFLKRLLLLFGGLVVLLASFHLVEAWRGRRAWMRWKQSREAVGFRYERAHFVPPPVADADNFARAPRIAESVAGQPLKGLPVMPAALADPRFLGRWREGQRIDLEELKVKLQISDLKDVLAPWEPELAALTEAARRPACRLQRNYDDLENIPHLLDMRTRARMLALRALVNLRNGHAEAALEDLETGLRVLAHLQQEPHLISQLLRLAWMNILMQPLWEGLQEHRWDAAQLARLQERLADQDLLESWTQTLHFERINAIQGLDRIRRESRFLVPPSLFRDVTSEPEPRLKHLGLSLVFPKGWIYQNQIRVDRVYTALLEPIDVRAHRIDPRKFQEAAEALQNMRRGPYTWLVFYDQPPMTGSFLRMAAFQVALDQARIACALERYRLEKGAYPEALAALAPAYLPDVPVDVTTGQPLCYRSKGKEGYTLYGLGWNLVDDGGKRSPRPANQRGGIDLTQGDWVWCS